MIAKYNNNFYYYNKTGNTIVTSDIQKINSLFERDDDVFYKRISMDELDDVFSVEYWAVYDSGFDGVSRLWRIINENDTIAEGKIKLIFAAGILPGWHAVEKDICEKRIDLDEIESFSERITYIKINGMKPDIPELIEKQISKQDIEEELRKYNRNYI